jgi:hypothetical protein
MAHGFKTDGPKRLRSTRSPRDEGTVTISSSTSCSPIFDWVDVAEIFRDYFPTIRMLYASGYSIGPPGQFFDKPYRPQNILRACTK